MTDLRTPRLRAARMREDPADIGKAPCVVSVPNSIMTGGCVGTRFTQQLAALLPRRAS